jgi:hypothetical protein
MRTGVQMPRHLRPCRVTWASAVYGFLGLALAGLWVTAAVLVMR